MSHNIDLNVMNMRTDLAIDEVNNEELEKLKEEKENGIKVFTVDVTKENQDKFNKKCGKYITISFDDVTDYNNSINVEKVFTSELKKMIESHNIPSSASCIIIGLGNEKSTPDSLGPLSINDIIVTNHLFSLGINVEDGFRVVSAFNPGVMGQTGIETSDIISALIKEIKPDFVIVVDALKASNVDRVNKTIQITDAGINPGSGIGNTRKEISKDVLNIPVFAVGVPTVVDTVTIVNDTLKYLENYICYMKNNMDNPKEKLKIVRTNIDKNNLEIDEKNNLFGLIGTLKEEDFIELEEKGAVGDVCTCFFDARGEAVSSSFAKRRISITLEELKKIPCKIGVASGLEKKEALHAALLGEYINILYADEELGKELIAI